MTLGQSTKRKFLFLNKRQQSLTIFLNFKKEFCFTGFKEMEIFAFIFVKSFKRMYHVCLQKDFSKFIKFRKLQIFNIVS